MPLAILFFCLGFLIGAFVLGFAAWILARHSSATAKGRLQSCESELIRVNESLAASNSQVAALTERAAHVGELRDELSKAREMHEQLKCQRNELLVQLESVRVEKEKTSEFLTQRIDDLSAVHCAMRDSFAAVSRDALAKNTEMLNASFKQSMEHFLKSAEKDRIFSNESLGNILKPLKESLLSVDKKMSELESSRQGAYSGLIEQISGLLNSQTVLQRETQNLASALNAPTIRGRWGEMQLRRVVELSGLSPHCDFLEQLTIRTGDDLLRPDMVITLPKNKKIVVDAKAPLEFFGAEKNDGTDGDQPRGHELLASLKRHILMLKKKAYHRVLGESPEFVVMFLPGEAFLYSALSNDRGLIEFAAQNDVIIATPMTLIAILKAIAFGFKQDAIATKIEDVRILAQQLIDRIGTVSQHFEKLGRTLRQSAEAYNQTLSSLNSRVLVTAKKLAAIKSLNSGPIDEEKKDLPMIDVLPNAIKLREGEDANL